MVCNNIDPSVPSKQHMSLRIIYNQEDSPRVVVDIKKKYKQIIVLITKSQKMYIYDVDNIVIYVNK